MGAKINTSPGKKALKTVTQRLKRILQGAHWWTMSGCEFDVVCLIIGEHT